MQSVYFTAPTERTTLGESHPSAEMQLVYSTAPANSAKMVEITPNTNEGMGSGMRRAYSPKMWIKNSVSEST